MILTVEYAMTNELRELIKLIHSTYKNDKPEAMVKNAFIIRDLQRILDFETKEKPTKVKRTVYYFNSMHLDDLAKGANKMQIGFSPKRTEYYDCPAIIEVQHIEYEFKVLYVMNSDSTDIRLSEDWYTSIDEWKRKDLIEGIALRYELYTPSKRVREWKIIQ